MSFSMISGWGLRSVLDAHLRATRGGLKVWLRLNNNPVDDTNPNDEFATYGFVQSVTGSTASGTSDILIDPPPDVNVLGMKEVGDSGQVLVGTHTFKISHTWVYRLMVQNGFDYPEQVFSNPAVIGLVYGGSLFSIAEYTREEAGGEYISWLVTGVDVNQQKVTNDPSFG